MKKALTLLATVLLIGCTKDETAGDNAHLKGLSLYKNDQHPDPEITIRDLGSIYEETIKIATDEWNGNQWVGFTFKCPSASLDRVLKFLFMAEGGATPEIHGGSNLPDCRFLIDFVGRKWESEKAARRDILLAIEKAFALSITYDDKLRLVDVKRNDVPRDEIAE